MIIAVVDNYPKLTFMWESHLGIRKLEESLITLLLLFNGIIFDKSSLFCSNGAIFTILFNESQVEYLREAFTKEKKKW